MNNGLTIVDALRDRRLFGALPEFHDLTTWSRWLVFLKATFGLALDDAELAIFRSHTARSEPRREGYPEAVAVVGVQSGKSFVAALIAALAAAVTDLRDVWAILVSQDARAALRTVFRYASRPFEEVPALRAMVVNATAGAIELRNGVTIAAYPCRPAAVRGLRAVIAVCDELAFFTATDGRPTDVEMLRALRGRLATTEGKLVVLSSPYGQSGALWDLHRRHYGRDDSPTLIWQASALDMNPTLPLDYIERMKQDDPEAYRSEVLGEFRTGIATFLDPDQVAACVVTGRRELPPVVGIRYSAHIDPAGGGADAFACAVGHRDGNRIVIDCLRAWHSKNPEGTVEECADLLRRYGVSSVTGDRYSAEWVREAFRKRGIGYEWSELDRSALFLELLPVINSQAIELLDDDHLLRELRGLERRRGSSGRDRVDHRQGQHDDRAVCVAGVASLAEAVRERGDLGISLGDVHIFSGGAPRSGSWRGREPFDLGEYIRKQDRRFEK